jgi:transcriptional regulator with XRE-family HTH domain
MAKRYEHASTLSRAISARRQERGLSFEKLGVLSGVNGAQAFRICRGEFKTLNPSVLRICNALGIQPEADGMALQPRGDNEIEVMLSAEVLTAWDRTEAGAMLLKRVLRAMHRDA